ncbi:MAG: AgmX/PglI C-terminal domain-containing protein [Polyangiaceae bacterium]
MSSLSPFASSSSNPFAALREEAPKSSRASYEMIPAGNAIDTKDADGEGTTLEIVIRWGESVLAIQHLETARSFFVGEEGCDHLVPSDKLGSSRAPLVLVEGSDSFAVVLPGAQARIVSNGRTLRLEDAVAEKLATASPSLAGAHLVRLALGMRVKSELNGFVFEIASVQASRKVAGKVNPDRKAFAAQALSFFLHGAVAASLFAFMPALASTDETPLTNEQKHAMQIALQDAAKPEVPVEEIKGDAPNSDASGSPVAANSPAPGAPGAAGNPSAAPSNKRFSAKGGAPTYTFDKKSAMQDAVDFGMVGILAQNDGMNTPSSPWSPGANGPDLENHNGNFWANELGDDFGPGGLHVSGPGDSGGPGIGIDVGPLSTINRGAPCTSVNCKNGVPDGIPEGPLMPTHKTTAPKLTPAAVGVSGHLPAEVIQRTVRQNFGRFRACYEAGLRNNPNLAGHVTVGFVIGADGAVGSSTNAGSDLPDSAVVSCIVGSFRGLSFAAPENGIVKVTYGLSLAPASN